jgi:transcriptional regulator GlxA family with amidase domain
LAKAGLLDGKRFTLHWENQASFVETFSGLNPTSNLYETDGDLLTAAGGASGTDLILQIIEKDFGSKLALVVADMCLHGRSNAQKRSQRTSQSALLENRNKCLVDAVVLMEANLEEPLSLEEIARYVQTSRRQLERNFKTYLSVSPRQYYTSIRITRAYALFGETNMSVSEIAAATGFNSSGNLSKHFRATYGVSPSHFRKTWSGQSQSAAQPETQEDAP